MKVVRTKAAFFVYFQNTQGFFKNVLLKFLPLPLNRVEKFDCLQPRKKNAKTYFRKLHIISPDVYLLFNLLTI